MIDELTREPEDVDDVQLCSYCGPRTGAIATEGDHIMNKALRRRPKLKAWADVTVPSCRLCNGRKYTLYRVPDNEEWRGRLDELYKLTGHRFYTWNGDPKTLYSESDKEAYESGMAIQQETERD